MKKVKAIYSFQNRYEDIARDIDPYREFVFYASIQGLRKNIPGIEVCLVTDQSTVDFLKQSGTYDLLDTVKVVDWIKDLGADEYRWYSPKWLGLSILPVDPDTGVLFLDLDAVLLKPFPTLDDYYSQDNRPEDGGVKQYEHSVFSDFSPWNGFKLEKQGSGGFSYYPNGQVAKIVSFALLYFQRYISRYGFEKFQRDMSSDEEKKHLNYYAEILLGEEHVYPAIVKVITGQDMIPICSDRLLHTGVHCKYPEHREQIIKDVQRLLEEMPESRKYYSGRLDRFINSEEHKIC